MARCDLRPHTFKGSMSSISASYEALKLDYTGIVNATSMMKKDWHTPKGYEEVNKLRNSVAGALRIVSNSIFNNYGEMKRSASEWAKEEHVHLSVGDLGYKGQFAETNDKMGEEEDAHIDRQPLADDASSFKKAKEKIYADLQEMIDQASSDGKFGYFSNGSSNPRKSLYDALVKAKNNIEKAVNAWEKDFGATVEADNAAIEAALQTSLDTADF